MVIDAMDLLYTGRFSGFCIVSSDGDFTRLAIRIREQGVRVYGFGAISILQARAVEAVKVIECPLFLMAWQRMLRPS